MIIWLNPRFCQDVCIFQQIVFCNGSFLSFNCIGLKVHQINVRFHILLSVVGWASLNQFTIDNMLQQFICVFLYNFLEHLRSFRTFFLSNIQKGKIWNNAANYFCPIRKIYTGKNNIPRLGKKYKGQSTVSR